MRYEFVEPIVNNVIRVLDDILQSDISKGDASLTRLEGFDNEIAIIIKLKGDSDGDFAVNMDLPTALHICSIMNGEECRRMSSVEMDIISELANMIAGNAIGALNDLGYDYSVSIPTVCRKGCDAGRAPQFEALQIPLFTECGEITINVAIGIN